MHAIKTPSFFRPSSRPSSPAPVGVSSTPGALSKAEPGAAVERPARPLTKLSLSSFRKSSPAPFGRADPAPTPLVQDGSYLEMLGLKLSEAVSKALAQPTGPAVATEQLNGKRPIPAGRGRALGALITSELNASHEKLHVNRAIIRCLHRPLSVLITNLSAHLLPLLSSSAFLIPPAPTPLQPNVNPTQGHAIALAAFAGELLETFDKLGLGQDSSDMRGDGLKGIRDGLDSVIARVVNPLIAGIKRELVPVLEALESPAVLPVHPGSRMNTGVRGATGIHPSIATLQTVVPIYAKAMARYTATAPTQTMLTTFLLSILWRGLVALAHRQQPPPTPPASPALAPALSTKKQGKSSLSLPSTPPSARFGLKLPPSRPPSPPSAIPLPNAAMDARYLFDLFNMFPRPTGDSRTSKLAREAVDDGFDGLKALASFLEGIPVKLAEYSDDAELQAKLDVLTSDLPTLVALPAMLRAYGGRNGDRTVAAMLNITDDEYRRGCLTGFARAEDCVTPVSQRTLEILRFEDRDATRVLQRWLENEIVLADQ